MKYKAKVSFSGLVSMSAGEVKELTDDAIIKDLLKAGYIEKVQPANDKKEDKKPTKAKKTTSK